ncbi:MAG: glycosyltransferase family 4 protein [Planctomycetes bacterium]|nr:glycosyltransferase family 4 protein [Planctomycetota bacterium]
MKLLYLRTVHAFNLTAGGSVGHTAGVINAFKKHIDIEVVSNDTLVGVNCDVNIVKPIIVPFLPSTVNEMLYNIKLIRKLSDISSFEAIYHRYSGFSFAGAYLARKKNLPLVLEFNSSDVWKIKHWEQPKNGLLGLLKKLFQNLFTLPMAKFLEHYNMDRASVIVVVSEVLKQNLLKHKVPRKKILVNPNGTNPIIYSPDVTGERIREKYNMQDKTVLGFIGTFGPWHGVVELANAIVRFYDLYPDKSVKSHFILIGNGNLMSDVQNIISASPYADKVILTGTIPQYQGPEYLAACDVLLSPHVPNPDGSAFFGSPTKLFEYMAMGKAIIASNLNQIGQVLKHKKTAYLVEPGSVDQLAEAMNTLVEQPQLCELLGENARTEVVSKYTWQIHTRNILEKLNTLTKEVCIT